MLLKHSKRDRETGGVMYLAVTCMSGESYHRRRSCVCVTSFEGPLTSMFANSVQTLWALLCFISSAMTWWNWKQKHQSTQAHIVITTNTRVHAHIVITTNDAVAFFASVATVATGSTWNVLHLGFPPDCIVVKLKVKTPEHPLVTTNDAVAFSLLLLQWPQAAFEMFHVLGFSVCYLLEAVVEVTASDPSDKTWRQLT